MSSKLLQNSVHALVLLRPPNNLLTRLLVEVLELSSRDSWGSWSPRNLELVELLPAVGCALLIVRMCIAPCSGHTEARGARSLVICGM